MSTPTTTFELAPDPVAVAAGWLVLAVWEGEQPTDGAAAVDGAASGVISRLIASGDATGKLFELVPVLNATGIAAKRILLTGLGRRDAATRQTVHDAMAAAARFVTTKQVGTLAALVPSPDMVLATGVGVAQGCSGPGIRKTTPTRFAPDRLILTGIPAETDLNRVWAEARALWLARELVNTPPCDLYPETFASRATEVGQSAGFEVEIWDEGKLAAERMGALLGVAQGSARPPRLIVLRYTANPGGPTLGLVGKGVTFDSGGLSLKTTEQMVDMKCDMAGAACVLAGVAAVAELKLRVNLLGVLAVVENMPGGRAFKLGDVLTARNGKTIEILNTDAEGRLILADALSYAADQKVNHLVDFATLTGACMIALGPHVTGLMTNNDPWGERVLAAIGRAGERAWKLPLDASYDEMIRSKVADMRNTGGSRYGGAITAAKLLQQFVADVPWAHLDIAGPSWAEAETPALDPGGTGCMVRSIVELATHYGERGA
ncbi:MAG TPA: leucyl aminopeptidase [Gemmataceae bacterium]|nr:leucyl aminopeptidase [Gemmataceae bacterium]